MNMFAVVGAAGKVGYSTASALRQAGFSVRVILRDQTKAAKLHDIGCEVAYADIMDSEVLAVAIGKVDAVQVIIPPSVKAKDGAKEMRRGIESIARALEKVQPKRTLVISDYGAHNDSDIGMPTLCRSFEDRLRQVGGHKLFLRSAEHMQNWARFIPGCLSSGTLMTFQDPPDVQHATVSAHDVGEIAANLLMRPIGEKEIEIVHAEGPRRYSARDVADVVGKLSGRKISVASIPRAQWKEGLEQNMSPSLADLLIKANDALNKGGLVDAEPDIGEIRCGKTELIDALRPFVPL